MTAEPRHFKDEVHDLVDGRLADELRAEIDFHLASCSECRLELETARWVKATLKADLRPGELPDDFVAALGSQLDEEAALLERERERRKFLIAAAAALAALVSGGLLWRYLAPRPLPERVASDFLRFRDGSLELDMASSSELDVEAFFTQNGIRFPTRVFDFRMMDYEVLGGRVHRLERRPSALFAYRGADGKLLLCQMYEGRVDELPGEPEVRTNDADIEFYVYRIGRVTVVFWQEGDVACALASDEPTEQVVALAFAKAVKVEVAG